MQSKDIFDRLKLSGELRSRINVEELRDYSDNDTPWVIVSYDSENYDVSRWIYTKGENIERLMVLMAREGRGISLAYDFRKIRENRDTNPDRLFIYTN